MIEENQTGDISKELSWVFILALPNSGSTALARLLLTAPNTIALQSHAEGQWLVPEMCAPQNRWDPKASLDYPNIKRRWLAAIEPTAGPQPVVIEKSPPNLCRIRSLLSMLSGMKTDVIILTRDPYATCASWHTRYGPERIGRKWGWPGRTPEDEDSYFAALAEIWLQRTAFLDSARCLAACCIRYEDFTERTAEAVARVAGVIPRLALVNPNSEVSVKDYGNQKLSNMNKANLGRLSEKQIRAIHRRLRSERDILQRLGYAV